MKEAHITNLPSRPSFVKRNRKVARLVDDKLPSRSAFLPGYFSNLPKIPEQAEKINFSKSR